ncbi:MBL fold metallo-hydrolase [Halarchaeum acidiphilum]|uniref:MBL fold metallo-hydrolase n=1 Tax=Halarchaeum acidiphilum TaxID=489138 RepID=UPI0009DBCE93|nr:MBL fold metallo-hydrolase [Halarchaeum acidiphilum]
MVQRLGVPLVCDVATASVLADRGVDDSLLENVVYGGVYEGDGWEAKVVEAHHQSAYVDEGVVGPAMAYVFTIGGERVYHMGDTAIFGDIELYGELYEPTVTLIPVGEADGYYAELHPDEAALVADWLPSEHFVPMHYPPGSEKPIHFAHYCEENGVTQRATIHNLDAGDHLNL